MKRKIIARAKDPQGEVYILCWLPQRREYCHWIVNDRGEHYLGRYFPNLEEVLLDFQDRVRADDERTEIQWQIPAEDWNQDQIALYFALEEGREKR